MRKKIHITESKLNRIIRETINDVVKSDSYHDYFDGYRLSDDNEECCSEKANSAFIDAINTIKNGGRFTQWLERHRDLTPYVLSSIYSDAERYWKEYHEENEELNVKPRLHHGTHTMRYPGENVNALNTNGYESMYAQGSMPGGKGSSRFRGMQAIRNGSNMSMDDAFKEYDRISNR